MHRVIPAVFLKIAGFCFNGVAGSGRDGNEEQRLPGARAAAKAIPIPLIFVMLLTAGAAFAAPGEDDSKTGKEEMKQAAPSGSMNTDIPQKKEEAVAARVNGSIITVEAVANLAKQASGKKGEDGETMDDKALKKKALDRLVLQELAYQQAQAQGLKVDKEMLDEGIDKIKASRGGEDGYKKFLETEGISDDGLRALIGKSMLVKQIITKEVTDKIRISEEELQKEYEKDKKQFFKPGRVKAVDIVFFLQADEPASLKKAQDVLEQVKTDPGKDPWKLVPDGTFIVRDLEIQKEFEPVLFEEAIQLKEGELSGVIRTADSLHILKLQEYIPEKQSSLDEVRVDLTARLIAKAKEKRFGEWKSELKKDAKIEIIDPSLNE